MKTLFTALLALCVAGLALAQPTEADAGATKRTPDDLRKLVAPIALYPDALVALILPAATNSADVVLAARYLSSGGDANQLDQQPWDESVKSLSRYAEVVKWMDENLTWTRALGDAFTAQPADVMNTIQSLRREAKASGALKDTPQQKVVVREQEICIEPASEEVVYVPVYDPDVIIYRRPVYDDSWIAFSTGFVIGSWLNYDCDWGRRSVVYCHRSPGWVYRSDWRWHNHVPAYSRCEVWRPNPWYVRRVHDLPRHRYATVPHVAPPRFIVDHHQIHSNPITERRWNDRDRRDFDRDRDRSPGVVNAAPEYRQRNWDRHDNDRRPGNPVGNRGRSWTPSAPQQPASNVVVAPAPVTPAPTQNAQNAIAAQGPNWRELRERRAAHSEDSARRNPHQNISAPASRYEVTSATRGMPPPAPSPRVSEVTPRDMGRSGRHERSFAPAPAQPAVAAPAPVHHSAPPPAPVRNVERSNNSGDNNNNQPNGGNVRRFNRMP